MTDQNSELHARVAEAGKQIKARRYPQALGLLQQLLTERPGNPELHFMAATALARLDKVDAALEAMERAAAIAPDHPKILDGLGILYDKTKRYGDAIAVYEKLLGKIPYGEAMLQVTLRRGVAMAKQGRYGEAADVFRYITEQMPGYAPGWHNLGNALVKTDQRQAAVDAFRSALQFDPENPYTNYGLGRSLLWVGQYAESIDLLTKAITLAPYELQILSYKVLALRHAERIEEADDLEGINDMVLSVEVPQPPEFSSLQSWNDALGEEIQNHAALTKEFENRATRNGAKVDHMFAKNKTPIFELFEKQIRTAFDEVILRMPKKEGHPLPLSASKGYVADMWANVMYDGGHQIPHNHPKGWFSACYYNALPDRVTDSGDAHEGWIEFGGTAYDFPEPEVTTKRQIQPEPGLMMVFPSYVFHRTIPFNSDQVRISCAFDAKPVGWRHS